MRKKRIYDLVLFSILMVLLFLPLLQAHVLHIPLKPLNGVTMETEQPKFNLVSYRSGDYAKQEEAYVGEHFGFREPVIRLYNQYLWSCYKKTYAHDVVAGKQGWLYTPESVSDYYGNELLRWQPSPEEARQHFDREIRYMNRVRTILKENDVEMLAFIAPEKSFLYPEYLPKQEYNTSTFNASEYFLEKFKETGFPCIDMTGWFRQMKDTVNYPLIPQTGAHWVFPAVYAADSLFRFMGDLKGIELPHLKIGELHEGDNHGADNDLEKLLNLALPIRKRQGYSPIADVTVESGPNSVKPKVLFIGNSFMWGIVNQVPMKDVFDEMEFWYYFSTAYTGDPLMPNGNVVDLNLLEKMLDFDYIVWFTTGNQLNKGTNGFANSAILTLGVDDSIRREYINTITDSLRRDAINRASTDTILRQEAIAILHSHPEIIPELNAETLTTQNRNIPYAKVIKDIRKDSTWMAALKAQAFLRSATMDQILHAEVDRIKAGKPLYKDQTDEIRFSFQVQEEVQQRIKRIPNYEKLMEIIREKAIKQNKPLEKAIEDDAIWMTMEIYGLDHCRLDDDPDAVIPIPKDFQLK
ncbi:MAG: hypothetical protein II829_00825 [Bacteroidales bacterium]|nr:hypothetical protein [Bacteroidales bacterium]